MNNEQQKRYSRQIMLQNFGEIAQEKMLSSKVLVIGAGGLGCPVIQYLTAGGVGNIGIVDHDMVSLSNLQRQVLFNTEDIGKNKALVASEKLKKLNPGIIIKAFPIAINNKNALELIRNYDIIVDCTDNFATRYLINDACVLLDKPLVFGAIYQYEGQVAVFNVSNESGIKINYRHLFPIPPSAEEAPDCATAGVLGVLPGIIGVMQAVEIIKLITGIGAPLINKMTSYNALSNETFTIDLSASHQTNITMPQNRTEFENMNYDFFCNTVSNAIEEINTTIFNKFLKDKIIAIIDVRELDETPFANFRNQQIPLSEWGKQVPEIIEKEVIVFCQSGKRSLKAAKILYEAYPEKKIYSLKGGILTLN
ncbi:ThiF family adenylyltransferase [Epilithonimonas sp. UC225_85]|uniref:ThiF family adenylyltransferase n=1 Tax=Epilithonimonas sp. UC225_85 TaxID=3350167 RepID=UPI0036D234F9